MPAASGLNPQEPTVTLLTSLVESEVLRAGLDPMLGFFHQPAYGRPSLALDIVEEFRPFIDALVLRLVNLRQLSTSDFEHPGADQLEAAAAAPDQVDQTGPEPNRSDSVSAQSPAVYLNQAGRRIFLTNFFRRFRQRIFYPPRHCQLELRQIVREQVYHLGRVIEGQEPSYEPFVPR